MMAAPSHVASYTAKLNLSTPNPLLQQRNTLQENAMIWPKSFLFILVPFLAAAQPIDPSLSQSLHWRMIGPHRGGRTVGAAYVPGKPNVYFIGVNNGGVWKTSDYGRTWEPIFDDQPTGSIGALAVAPSNPDVIYVGSGEGLQRPDLSVGDGMFKSTDGGRTWRNCGLNDAQQIGSVLVDPLDPDRIFVAVLGHPYGANKERGVFRSLNGGTTWQNVLSKDENTGAIALAFDPTNSRVVYADLWSARLAPWENGWWQGKTSGLYKSTDGGTSWRHLTTGLPTAEQGVGRIGFCIAQSDPSRLYATVDAWERGGIYRSDDAGETWRLINNDPRLWGRGDDFAEIDADPRDENRVFVANVGVHASTDAAQTWSNFKGAPGGDDYHTLLINPEHPEIMLLASDQGAVISVNGGQTWSSWYNQPTAQFYHVSTDNAFPYNVYGGQQESGSVGIASRGSDGQITFREWHPVGADEYAYVAPDPLDPDIIYGGRVTRYDKTTGQTQNVAPEALRSGNYRMLRTMPLLFSPVDPHVLYFATNVLWRTTCGGRSWELISPDLSREQPDVPGNIGIFTTRDLKSMPRRGVIYAVAPSYKDGNMIWAGTDDGLIHVTRDGGKTWADVTPPELSSWSKIAQIDAGRFNRETAYAAVNRIRLDDQRPYLYRTHDGGRTWKEIVHGLPEKGPVNTIREDPVRKGLLFAGTERAVYVSFDDGERWQSIRENMPATSIRDLVVKDDDIVVGTHGRSFWILDNITPLRQFNDQVLSSDIVLFKPQNAVRVRWNMNTDTPLPPDEPAGENPPDGANIDYYLKNAAKVVTLEIVDSAGRQVRLYSSADPPDTLREQSIRYPLSWVRPSQGLSTRAGVHRFRWDMRYTPPAGFNRWLPMSAIYKNTEIMPVGPWAHPGQYGVVLTVDGRTFSETLFIRMDPRVKTPAQDLQMQFQYSLECWQHLRELHDAVQKVQSLRSRLQQKINRATGGRHDSLKVLDRLAVTVTGIDALEEVDVVYSGVSRVRPGDASLSSLANSFNYLMALMQSADVAPTEAQMQSLAEQRDVKALVMTKLERIVSDIQKEF
jgi:photosystem II stability/assembly factor-like uncharacterized protein